METKVQILLLFDTEITSIIAQQKFLEYYAKDKVLEDTEAHLER